MVWDIPFTALRMRCRCSSRCASIRVVGPSLQSGLQKRCKAKKPSPLWTAASPSAGAGKELIERVESRHGLRQLSYMKELGMGNDRYTLIDLDNDDAVITAAEAVKDIKPGWEPDRYNTFFGRNRHR